MGMRINRLADAQPFAPQGHTGVGPVHLQGGEASPTEGLTVVLSHYLPGGQAEMASQPCETIYVVIAGQLAVISERTDETLHVYDSAHFTAGTLRQVINRTSLPASMLVIRPKSR